MRGAEREQHAKTWRELDTVDAWRHKRMHRVLDPIIREYPDASWLTVGDGRFASDARYLCEKGISVMATDISDSLLKEAKDEGFIKQFKKENAETLSFQDASYDFVLCKESFHHFPRPMIALYEMLRVCRMGVILVEPNDTYIDTLTAAKVKHYFKRRAKEFLGRKTELHAFEKAGNYVYKLSRHEVEKVALGMNYRTVAFRGINDYYTGGVEYEKADPCSALFRKVSRRVRLQDFLCKLRLSNYALLVSIIFKQCPGDEFLDKLKKTGYDVVYLPKNPYFERKPKP